MTGSTTAPATEASGGPTTVSPSIEYWRRVTPPERGFAPGPRYRTPWAWEAVFRPARDDPRPAGCARRIHRGRPNRRGALGVA
jgi:hypothetical protein